MKQMLLKAETLLFTYRFSCMNRAELQNLMTQLRTIVDSAHRWHSIEFNDLLNIFRNLLHSMTINELVERYFDGGSDNTIMVPFEYVLSLVAKRTVGLKKGVAQVPYEKLCILMTILFEKVLSLGVNVAKKEFSPTVLQDTRMRNLYREIKVIFSRCMFHQLFVFQNNVWEYKFMIRFYMIRRFFERYKGIIRLVISNAIHLIKSATKL